MHSLDPSEGNGSVRCLRADMSGNCADRHGRRGPRMFDPGMLRYVVLQHIAQQPRHGYDLIKLLQEQSGGLYTPSPGMIYPMLALLEDMGLVSVAVNGNKKLYSITEQGRHFLEQNRAMVTAIEQQLSACRHSGVEQVRARLQALRDAVFIRVRGQQASPEQIEQIKAVLNQALAEIEAL